MKNWNKFHAIFGSLLKVGFETTFSKSVVLNLDPLYEKNGMIHKSPREPIIRLYEPAEVLGSCKNGDAVQVFFEPVLLVDPRLLTESLFRRLVFARKIDLGKHWMVAARHSDAYHSELSHFGFDSWNSRNPRYLPLAYGGVKKEFIPVYFKIQTEGGDFVYLEVWAWDEGKNTVVQALKVSDRKVPKILKSAEPGLS